MPRLAVLAFVVLVAVSGSAEGQSRTESPDDSLFRRARKMVADGQGAMGRSMVDSLLRRATEGTSGYGDALYWRGALAETAAEAERDYRRVIVEYPLSPYADDALLAIAELEQARGDRAGALQHLLRFVREHPVSTARGTAALAAARLAFDQRDARTACTMIAEGRASTTAADVELRNQLEYLASRCPNNALPASAPPPQAPTTPPLRVRDTTSVTTPTVVPVPQAPALPAERPRVIDSSRVADRSSRVADRTTTKPSESPSPRREPVATPTAPRAGNYTIQVAAYNTRIEAERLIAKLATRKVTARVSGTAKPFRVRLGFHATRQSAVDEVASLKARGIIGFVTTEAPAPERAVP